MLIMENNTLPRYTPAPYSMSGLGALFSPALAATRAMRGCGVNGCGWYRGVGADDAVATPVPEANVAPVMVGGAVAGVLVIGLLALAGVLSYQAGKAMTPPGSSKKTWGWVGVPVGIFTGAPGLGVMGWVSNAKK